MKIAKTIIEKIITPKVVMKFGVAARSISTRREVEDYDFETLDGELAGFETIKPADIEDKPSPEVKPTESSKLKEDDITKGK